MPKTVKQRKKHQLQTMAKASTKADAVLVHWDDYMCSDQELLDEARIGIFPRKLPPRDVALLRATTAGHTDQELAKRWEGLLCRAVARHILKTRDGLIDRRSLDAYLLEENILVPNNCLLASWPDMHCLRT